MRCTTCRGLMVEVFDENAATPGHTRLGGWRCLKCGAATEQTATAPPPMKAPWLQSPPSDTRQNPPRVIYSLPDGLCRRRESLGGGSPGGSSLQTYAEWEHQRHTLLERHWWA